MGRPRAFIESAWRSYTRHSKNKVQEIQSAVLPVAAKHRHDHPFLGAVLAGDFTAASLEQLRSSGFRVIYCPHDRIVDAFKQEGIDVTLTDDSEEEEIKDRIQAFTQLSQSQLARIHDRIIELNRDEFGSFFDSLQASLSRSVAEILVRPIFGTSSVFTTLEEAIYFISINDETIPVGEFTRYEIEVRYSNGDNINANPEAMVVS